MPSIIQEELVSPGWTLPVSMTMGLSHNGMFGLDKGLMEWSETFCLGLEVIVTIGTSCWPANWKNKKELAKDYEEIHSYLTDSDLFLQEKSKLYNIQF